MLYAMKWWPRSILCSRVRGLGRPPGLWRPFALRVSHAVHELLYGFQHFVLLKDIELVSALPISSRGLLADKLILIALGGRLLPAGLRSVVICTGSTPGRASCIT